MTKGEIVAAFERARGAGASSDYDLNAGFQLHEGRRLRDAAVLVSLVERPAGWQVILTKRPNGMKHHPGQVAFPGGKVDASDSSHLAAALREAEEEIGLPQSHVQILGELPSHETVTGFTVYPFVGLINERFTAIPEAYEVEEVFEVPATHVLTPANYQIVSRRWAGQDRYYYTVPYGPYYIWGATARMLRSFAGGADAD